MLASALLFFQLIQAQNVAPLKVYDKPGQRASCPTGFKEKGRFAEMARDGSQKVRGGMECIKGADTNPGARQNTQQPPSTVPPRDLADQPQQLTLEEKNGKAPKCPEGYVQTGSFSNAVFANGKLSKTSGIHCMKTQLSDEDLL